VQEYEKWRQAHKASKKNLRELKAGNVKTKADLAAEVVALCL
jgi:hypothetical protein